jgi:hypothetical protein
MLFVSNILDFRFIPLFISKEAYSYSINGFKTYEFICKIFINRKVFPTGACYYCPYIQKNAEWQTGVERGCSLEGEDGRQP